MKPINGILLLYHHPLSVNAPAIKEHVNAFGQYSKFKVWNINTAFGFPKNLRRVQFQVIVLHYSIFDPLGYKLSDEFLSYLEESDSSYKIAFLQDEYHYCQQRFAFLNRYRIDSVYTLCEPVYFKDVYFKYTSVKKVIYHIPGYVSDDLMAMAARFSLPDNERTIDIGYRGRRLPYYMGKGAQEKTDIALKFLERAANLNLRLDIQTDETRRIYGDSWYKFLANCHAVLGVEAGVSIFDLNDEVRLECQRLLEQYPEMSFDEASERLLSKWENNIPYRVISPRHFEAAAFRVCQILYEGKYSGVMKAGEHYIELKKDYSNFEEVIKRYRDEGLRREITERAYREMIESGSYSYRRVMEEFDKELFDAGLDADISAEDIKRVTTLLAEGQTYRHTKAWLNFIRYYPFPGRDVIRSLVKDT